MRVLIAVGHLLVSLVAAAGAEAPILFQRSVDIDNRWQANVVIREGQEPADAIFTALRPYGVDHSARRTIFEEAKKEGVPLQEKESFRVTECCRTECTYQDHEREPGVDLLTHL